MGNVNEELAVTPDASQPTSLAREVACSNYHQSIWQGVPEGLDPPDLELRLAFLLGHAEAAGAARSSPPRVLDVGCGEGRFAAELARRGFPVVAVDVAEEPLRRARAREPALELQMVPAEGRWPMPASTSCGRARPSST